MLFHNHQHVNKKCSAIIKEACGVIWTVIRSIAISFFQSIFFFLPRKYKDIQSDVILITGGGRGIGRLIAFEIARHKPKQIILWGRNSEPLEATARAIRLKDVPCDFAVCDISNQQQVSAKAAEVHAIHGCVDILINNAGVVFGNTILNSNPADIDSTLATNALGNMWLIKAFLPLMVASNRGHLVSMNSMLGLMGLAGAADYCASKHALTGFYDSLRLELLSMGCNGIKLTSVHPYLINTDMFAGASIRFPSLFPMLDRDYVAWKTVDGILTEQPMVLMPRFMYFLTICRSILPVDAMWHIQKFNGVDKTMETFHGRSKNSSLES